MRLPQLIPVVVVVVVCCGGKPMQIQRPQPDVPRVLLTAETVFVARENLPVKRLPPSAFRELPRRIVRELEAEGCAIPQPEEALAGSGQHNVIRGDLCGKGSATGWCSAQRTANQRSVFSGPKSTNARTRY
ncbi:MAG TPA: hypothetical protein VGY48_06890 [Vicinamibacterales bacterium]|jgi:hypothetical protein|nr:hypothetical protein [Vicinamibacterales bacterium]